MSTNKRTALSLFETLVVIVIVAVLAAILAVVFTSTKRAAKKTGCISNLRQLGSAHLLYAADYDSRLPPYLTSTLGDGDTGFTVHANVERWRFCLYPYLNEDSVFFCPADENAGTGKADEGFLGGNSRFTSYEHTPILQSPVMQDDVVSPDLEIETDRENAGYLQDRLRMVFNESEGKKQYVSYHGETMVIWYLTGQAKSITIQD